MNNSSDTVIRDLEDSQNVSFEELAYENEDKFIKVYFYKCKSYLKEQKARIVNERGAISILCIETDLSNEPFDLESYFNNENPIINGFITIGELASNNIKLDKQNFNDSKSLLIKSVQQPVLDINLPLDFLIDNIYIVSFKDLSLELELNYDDIFLIDETINENPLFINQNDIEQVQVNRLSLIPLSSYNNARTNFISLNKVKPIQLGNIKTDYDDNTKYIFSMNNQEQLFSNIQGFTNILSSNIEMFRSCEIDIWQDKNDIENIISKYPVKLCANNFNEVLEFDNEWLKNCLEWNIAKDFLQQKDLDTILTIKNIPNIDLVLDNVKIKSIDLKIDWSETISNPIEQNDVTYHKILDNDFHYSNGNIKGWLRSDITGGRVYVMDNEHDYNLNRHVTWSSKLINNNNDIILILNNGIEQNFSGYKIKNYNDIIIDVRFMKQSDGSDPTFQDISNINLGLSLITGNFESNIENKFIFYYNLVNIFNWPTDSNFYPIIDWYLKLQDKTYDFLTLTKSATNDPQLLVKLFQSILKYTVNYRLGFPDAKFENVTGNPQNDMAKLKVEFEITGTNPLENISNKINNFKMLNPWVVDIPEWDIFIKCIAMLSQEIYSTYSLNTGVKAEEEVTLPYYFKFLTPAIKIGPDNNYTYDYVSLQVRLESKYFDFTQYNTNKFDAKILLNKLPSLNSKLSVVNNYLKITYPFINSSIIETQTSQDPQKYDISNEDYQRYILYFITTRNTNNDTETNSKVFDEYMNTLFQVNNNYVSIKNEFEQFSCKTSDSYFSSDDSIVGDLPFTALFNNNEDSDELDTNNLTLQVSPGSPEPIEEGSGAIKITKEL